MRLLIADDHDLVRETISSFLEREGGYTVASVADYHAAEETLRQEDAFDLILLDYAMPGMPGVSGIAAIRALSGGSPVAILSGSADRRVAHAVLEAGAAGFLPKTMGARSMINAVRFMLLGEQYAPLDFMTKEDPSTEHPLAAGLSEREKQVLGALCQGLSNKEIARSLNLQEVTIKLHVKTLCRKLDAKNRTQAAMTARDAGLV